MLLGYQSTTKHYGRLATTLPLPSHEDFQVSCLHCLPPCVAGVSLQIITQLLEVSVGAEGEIKSDCAVCEHQLPPTSAGQAALELLMQVTACQGKLGEK